MRGAVCHGGGARSGPVFAANDGTGYHGFIGRPPVVSNGAQGEASLAREPFFLPDRGGGPGCGEGPRGNDPHLRRCDGDPGG